LIAHRYDRLRSSDYIELVSVLLAENSILEINLHGLQEETMRDIDRLKAFALHIDEMQPGQ